MHKACPSDQLSTLIFSELFSYFALRRMIHMKKVLHDLDICIRTQFIFPAIN